MKNFDVSVVTPDGVVVDEQYQMVIAHTKDGEIGVLAGHIPLVAPLVIGEVRLKKESGMEWLSVSGGFLEVRPDKVTVLAQTAEKAETIDLARAQEAKRRAEAMLAAQEAKMDDHRAQTALHRAMNRIKVAGHRQ